MLFLVLLSLAGCCSAKDVLHRGRHGNVVLKSIPDNPYMMLHTDNGYPITIEYFRTIVRETELMVRVSFSDGNDTANANETILNICDILDRALFDPESTQARYNMASNFGMTGSACPIEVGIRILPLYEFSIELATMDLGDGEGYYVMTVEIEDLTVEPEDPSMKTENQTVFNETIMDAQVNSELTRDNETSTENSSDVVSTPAITMSVFTTVIAITFAR